jgi:hypothetical protein
MDDFVGNENPLPQPIEHPIERTGKRLRSMRLVPAPVVEWP